MQSPLSFESCCIARPVGIGPQENAWIDFCATLGHGLDMQAGRTFHWPEMSMGCTAAGTRGRRSIWSSGHSTVARLAEEIGHKSDSLLLPVRQVMG